MPAATLPEQFGRYRILKPLGKGGMGAVYLAEDTQLGRRVALKVPHIDEGAGPNVLERFYREARAAAALDHPNICTLYDVGTHDGITYLTSGGVRWKLCCAVTVGCLVVSGAVGVGLLPWVGQPQTTNALKDKGNEALVENKEKEAPVKDEVGAGKGVKDKQRPAAAVEDVIRDTKFVRVPKGTFWMGGGSVEGPPTKQVTIDNDFELAAYTVTQGQWEAVMGVGSNPSYFSRERTGSASVAAVSIADLRRFPVEMVSWNDVQKFLAKLNAREQGKGWKYRLPREVEWEYACRGGGGTSKEECSFDFYFAKATNDLSWNQANFNGDIPGGNGAKGKSLGRTSQVGQYQPNKLGLYDMQGNVWQWCEDLYDDKGSGRVFRGGGWGNGGPGCRAAFRRWSAPPDRNGNLGFRLARVPSGS